RRSGWAPSRTCRSRTMSGPRSSRTTPCACSGWRAEMTTTTAALTAGAASSLGERLYPVADWYDAESLLTDDERRVLGRLRTFLAEQATPLLAEYWERGEFPEQLAKPLIDL